MKYLILSILFSIFTLGKLFFQWKQNQYLTKFNRQLISVLENVATSLKAGSSFLQALTLSVQESQQPLQGEFQSMIHDYRLGIPLEEALEKVCIKVPIDDLRILLASVRMAQSSGGSLAEILGNLSTNLREQFTIREKCQAFSSQAKAQSILIAVLPFFIFLLLFHFERNLTLHFLYGKWGAPSLAMIIFMETLALLWMQKMMDIKT